MSETIGQTNARDVTQLKTSADLVAQLEARRTELLRALLADKATRECVFDVLLPLFQIYARIGGPLEQVYGQAALHNAGCEFLEALQVHRDLFMQGYQEWLRRQRERLEQAKALRASSKDEQDDEL